MVNNTDVALFLEQLSAMCIEYARAVPDKIREIETTWNQLCHSQWDGETFKTFHRLTHSLAGSGATFGFTALSEGARTLKRYLESIIERDTPPTDAQQTQINTFLLALKQAAIPSNQSASLKPLGERNGMKTLIVEDDASMRQLFERVLRLRGHSVTACIDAETAWEAYHPDAGNYPLVILDWVLPGMDGLSLCRQMRSLPHGDCSVILVETARDQSEDLQAVLEAGADDYLTKPVNIEALDVRLAIAEQRARLLAKRKQAEEALKESLELIEQAKKEWALTVDSLPLFICLLDNQGRILRANRTVERWNLGPVLAVKGRDIHELFHPDCTASACYLKTFWLQAQEKLAQGRSAECEAEDTILKRHLHVQVQPISVLMKKESQETASFAVVILHDITERVRLEKVLLESRTLSSLNRTVASIAHEMRTPLAAADMDLEDVLDELPDGELKALVLQAQESIQEALLTIRTMMKVYRGENQKVTGVDVNQKLTDAVLLFGRKTKGVEVLYDFRDDTRTWVSGNLSRIFVNLIGNALDALHHQGQLQLTTRFVEGNVFVEVEDNGPGIPPEILDKIFEPEFSTKKSGEGTGLGLWITKSEVERMGGRITVESEVGKFTRFRVTLPRRSHHNEGKSESEQDE